MCVQCREELPKGPSRPRPPQAQAQTQAAQAQAQAQAARDAENTEDTWWGHSLSETEVLEMMLFTGASGTRRPTEIDPDDTNDDNDDHHHRRPPAPAADRSHVDDTNEYDDTTHDDDTTR